MKSILLFLASVMGAHCFLLIERLLGIAWDFHPDAVGYILNYDLFATDLANVPNNFYFFVSAAFSGNVFILIELNILAYAAANVLGYRYLRGACKEIGLSHIQGILLIVIFLCQPYRLHLAVHVLKDTLIFLLLVFAITQSSKGKRLLILLCMMAFRLPSFLYLTSLISPKKFIALLFLGFMVALVFANELTQFLMLRNEVDMGGREFNVIPNFAEYGLWGTSFRAISWPILLLSGTFWIFSPSILMLPISVEMLFARVVAYKAGKLATPWLPILATLSLMAIMVNSYTAYIRYAYPLISVIPLLVIQNMRKNK